MDLADRGILAEVLIVDLVDRGVLAEVLVVDLVDRGVLAEVLVVDLVDRDVLAVVLGVDLVDRGVLVSPHARTSIRPPNKGVTPGLVVGPQITKEIAAFLLPLLPLGLDSRGL